MKHLVVISSDDTELVPLIRHIIEQDELITVLAQKVEETVDMIGGDNVLAILIDSQAAAPALYDALRVIAQPQPQPGVITLIDPVARRVCTDIAEAGIRMVLERPVDPARILEALNRLRAERISDKTSARRAIYSDLEMDFASHRVSRSGRQIALTAIEFQLLRLLMIEPTRVYSRRELIQGAWPAGVYVDERTVNVHMGRLRRALVHEREADLIRTVRGVGYALDSATAGDPGGPRSVKR